MGSTDPYFDEDIGDLRNLLGAKSSDELKIQEPQVVFANELELSSVGIPRTNDLAELLAIHEQLFKGVYDWAGQIRTVDIKKNTDSSEFFLVVSKIKDASHYVFSELQNENHLRDLNLDDFVQKMAYYYDQLNYIHPFREGNGRAQRIFWTRIARDAGYEIDWGLITGDENDEASRIAVEESDVSHLVAMFMQITKVSNRDAENDHAEVIDAQERANEKEYPFDELIQKYKDEGLL